MSIPLEVVRKMKFLRQHGYSIPEISRECRAPKSSVWRHVSAVTVFGKYQPRLLARRSSSEVLSVQRWEIARKNAERTVVIGGNDNLKLLGAMLYWAEGAKKDFSFSNTDPAMIGTFVEILRRVYGVKDDDLKVSI